MKDKADGLKQFYANVLYSILHHSKGITRPDVWLGHFPPFEPHQYQKRLFNALRKDEGFKRTPFQVVFPGQTAGLIKRLDDAERSVYSFDDEIDEAHVRFFDDGAISCELEPNRFYVNHYAKGSDGNSYLESLVQKNKSLTPDEKSNILSQIEFKDVRAMYMKITENRNSQEFAEDVRFCGFVLDCYALSFVGNIAWAAASLGAYVFYDKVFGLLYEHTHFFQMIIR